MNIGLISINMYTKGLNFACPLHTFAFQQFLLANGVESTIIDYKPVYYGNYDLRHPADFYERLVAHRERTGNLDGIEVLREKRDGYRALYHEREVRHDKFQAFIDSHYIKTDRCYDSDLLEVEDPGFDCYICVTDVIWKKEPGKGFDRGFFLASKAMEGKKKIAYAASRGVFFAENEKDERQFFHYVNDIDYIGVREQSLQEYIEDNTGREVSMVLDPVMLNDRSLYDGIAQKPPEEGYLFVYYVMEQAADTLDQAVAYARAHNLKIVEATDRPLPHGRLSHIDDIEVIYRYDIGIEEWLGYFKYADVVFTNSFHASCFSILFEKEFYVGSRNGDKVTNVLNQFGLSDRRFNKDTDLLSTPATPIDYAVVGKRLAEKRAQSSDFILGAIHALEQQDHPAYDYRSLKEQITYPLLYNSRTKGDAVEAHYPADAGTTTRLKSGSLEFEPSHPLVANTGESHFVANEFSRKDHRFTGWNLRVKIDNRWFWYLENGTLALKDGYRKDVDADRRLFPDKSAIPFIDVGNITIAVAEANWKLLPLPRMKKKLKSMLRKLRG